MSLDKDQLAYEWNSLPRFIYIRSDGQPWNFEADLASYPCCGAQFKSPWALYADIQGTAKVPLDLTMEDVIASFTLLNPAYAQLLHAFNDDFFFFQNTIHVPPEELAVMERMWRDQDRILNALLLEKAQFRAAYERQLAESRSLEQVKPFLLESSTTLSTNQVYSFEKRSSLLDLFDTLEVSPKMPLVATRDFYKILVGFPYAIDAPMDTQTLFLHVQGQRHTVTWNEDYVRPRFELTLPKEQQVEPVCDQLHISRRDLTKVKERLTVSLIFSAPDLTVFDFNKYVWADMIMNVAPLASRFVIDEHERIHRAAASIYMFWLKSPTPTAFTIRAAQKRNVRHKRMITEIEVKLLHCDTAFVPEVSADLATALGFYYEHMAQTARAYNEFLSAPIRLKKPARVDVEAIELKAIEPELFVTNYKRSCQYVPQIVDESEVKDLEEKGYQVMLFPRVAQHGVQPRYYTCAMNAEHVYPGLRINNLSNKERFPLLPCCFKEDQAAKRSHYQRYLEGGEQALLPRAARRGFIKTTKTLGADQTGEVPAKLKELFLLLGAPESIIRHGTLEQPASVLECILYDELEELSVSQRASRLRQERRRLADVSDEVFAVLHQEAWLMGLDRAREILRDPEAYLDPRLFFSLLEFVYNCRLVLLDRENFIPPNFAHSFAHFPNGDRVVVVYENFGGEAEHRVIPQCEVFLHVSGIVDALHALYARSLQMYSVSSAGSVRQLPFVEDGRPETETSVRAQHLNMFGQVIGLNVMLPAGEATFQLAYPLPPLPLPITTRVMVETMRAPPIVHISYGTRMYVVSDLMPLRPRTQSWMQEFVRLRKVSRLLQEQAKRAHAKRQAIVLGPLSDVERASERNEWTSVSVPSVLTRQRLDYAVEQFEKYHKDQLEMYKKYSVVPNKYVHVDDFKRRPRELVARTLDVVEWEPLVPVLADAPTLNAPDFYMVLNGRIYHCVAVAERLASTNEPMTVGVWNTRTVFQIGASASDVLAYLFYKRENVVHTFRCFVVRPN